MPQKKRGFKRVVAFGDQHAGHRVGLTPPKWQTANQGKKYHKIQQELWNEFTYIIDKLQPIDVLIVNGAECEPFLTCDHRLMLEKSKEIILGIYLACKMLGIKNVIIAIEDNKLDAIESLGSALFRDENKECNIKLKKTGF